MPSTALVLPADSCTTQAAILTHLLSVISHTFTQLDNAFEGTSSLKLFELGKDFCPVTVLCPIHYPYPPRWQQTSCNFNSLINSHPTRQNFWRKSKIWSAQKETKLVTTTQAWNYSLNNSHTIRRYFSRKTLWMECTKANQIANSRTSCNFNSLTISHTIRRYFSRKKKKRKWTKAWERGKILDCPVTAVNAKPTWWHSHSETLILTHC